MKNLLLILFICSITFSVSGQDNSKNKKLSRKEKKELRKKEDNLTKIKISKAVESKKFVFEADQIIDREGKTYPANSNINFISLDSNKVIFQLGSATMIGVNGVGGVTIDGTISTFKLDRNEKNGYYHIIMKVESNFGFYDISMDISALGGTAAVVRTSDNKKLGYSGQVVPLDESRVYKGSSF